MAYARRPDPVALPEGALVVNSSQGGGSKDTWVLAHSRRAGAAAAGPGRGRAARLRRQPARQRPAAAQMAGQQQ
ncbi:hypothetical protein GCM10020218_090780 [Dactylosporangium vinaceum]